MQDIDDGTGELTVAVGLDPMGSVQIAGHLCGRDGGLLHAGIATCVASGHLGPGDELVLDVSKLASVSPSAEVLLRREKRYLDGRGIRLTIATSRPADSPQPADPLEVPSGRTSELPQQRDGWRSPPLRLVTSD